MKVSIDKLTVDKKRLGEYLNKLTEEKAKLVHAHTRPITVKGKRVLDGHKRIAACKILGIEEIEVQQVAF